MKQEDINFARCNELSSIIYGHTKAIRILKEKLEEAEKEFTRLIRSDPDLKARYYGQRNHPDENYKTQTKIPF